ncbi:MAG: uroporphyrinogen-III synthase [Betaproteobacteria bacterium]|jgi:uroporphyrinogen-III synthase
MTPTGGHPLAGCAILVTRPEHQAGHLRELIRELGGTPISLPTILIEGLQDQRVLQQVLPRLVDFDFAVFSSSNAASFTFQARPPGLALPDSVRLVAIGSGTAGTLRRLGMKEVLTPAAGSDSEAVLDLPELQDLGGKRVVIFTGVGGRQLLGNTLEERGATVTVVPCYRRISPGCIPEQARQHLAARRVDAVTITSGEGLVNLYRLLDADRQGSGVAGFVRSRPHFVAHPRIADLARQTGVSNIIIAGTADEAMVAAMLGSLLTTRDRASLH